MVELEAFSDNTTYSPRITTTMAEIARMNLELQGRMERGRRTPSWYKPKGSYEGGYRARCVVRRNRESNRGREMKKVKVKIPTFL
ncbi:hypothetical protein CR513_09523, partial [Mucuna pruriens]